MGFKEIKKFNDALLAKQVWRMMHNPDFLCYKVFKARFFPNCSILEAKDSTVGSYAWKSILNARDVVRKDLVWQVGNGQSMCIREDKWLPDQICKSVMIPPPSLPPDAKVSLLIDPESATWKVDQVQQLFIPLDAKLILSIPQSARLPPDRLIWSQTPMGVFTTHNAYKMLANSAMANNASSSNPNPQKQFWRGLWKLHVPNKVKVFAWRACNRALSIMDNLVRRHIVDLNCAQYAKLVLKILCMWYWATPRWNRCGGSMISEDNRAELFICMAWSLWHRQNTLRIGLPSPLLKMVGPQATKFLQDFLNAQEDQPTCNPTAPTNSWCPLSSLSFKANFDGAIFNNAHSAGVGVVICDVSGEVIAAMSKRIPLPNSMLKVEAMACR
ncbi:hypothetical protein SO802_003520 [Lithocarpus litseifolius]|uniref:Reverse transcriptase zinc-binding domain-containing protein n=1 Tax=Lithocarpus litseifolius TaxID=425828 RepID=A0AAW2E189_9ROSI